MKILSLDLGCKTGWATNNASGTVEFNNGRHDGGGMRFLRFGRWLKNMRESIGGIDAVFYEEVAAHKGTAAAHTYGGFHAILVSWCENNKIPYKGIPVGTIKRHATGKGNSNKEVMMSAYLKKFGENAQDDNECDARWLLDLVCRGGF